MNNTIIRIIALILLLLSVVLCISGLLFSSDPRLLLWGMISLVVMSVVVTILQKSRDV